MDDSHRMGCERAKKALTLVSSTKIEVESAHEGIDFSVNLSRAKFDELASSVTAKTTSVVEAALANAAVAPADLSQVLSPYFRHRSQKALDPRVQ